MPVKALGSFNLVLGCCTDISYRKWKFGAGQKIGGGEETSPTHLPKNSRNSVSVNDKTILALLMCLPFAVFHCHLAIIC